jgi:uncharacterized protein YodC (DUF2158 family)
MTQPFQPGDIVALRSGGYPMTVIAVKAEMAALAVAAGISEPAVVQCHWFDDRGACNARNFTPASLARIVRRTVMRDEATGIAVWVFVDSGDPIADHVAMVV